MIRNEQIAFFRTFGFLFLPQLFSYDEMCGFSERFDELLDKERDGAPFPGQTRQSLYMVNFRVLLLTDSTACRTFQTARIETGQ